MPFRNCVLPPSQVTNYIAILQQKANYVPFAWLTKTEDYNYVTEHYVFSAFLKKLMPAKYPLSVYGIFPA